MQVCVYIHVCSLCVHTLTFMYICIKMVIKLSLFFSLQYAIAANSPLPLGCKVPAIQRLESASRWAGCAFEAHDSGKKKRHTYRIHVMRICDISHVPYFHTHIAIVSMF